MAEREDAVDLGEGATAHDVENHRHQRLGMAVLHPGAGMGENAPILQERGRAAGARRIQSKNAHHP